MLSSKNCTDINAWMIFQHPDAVSGVDFHPKGTHVCTSCADSNVRVWSAHHHSYSLEPTVLRGHSGALWSCAFSANGAHIASTSSDRTIAMWDWCKISKVTCI